MESGSTTSETESFAVSSPSDSAKKQIFVLGQVTISLSLFGAIYCSYRKWVVNHLVSKFSSSFNILIYSVCNWRHSIVFVTIGQGKSSALCPCRIFIKLIIYIIIKKGKRIIKIQNNPTTNEQLFKAWLGSQLPIYYYHLLLINF